MILMLPIITGAIYLDSTIYIYIDKSELKLGLIGSIGSNPVISIT